jgi:hypothetical protein
VEFAVNGLLGESRHRVSGMNWGIVPAAQCCLVGVSNSSFKVEDIKYFVHFDDDVTWIYDFGNWSVFDYDSPRAFEDHCFHRVFCHHGCDCGS